MKLLLNLYFEKLPKNLRKYLLTLSDCFEKLNFTVKISEEEILSCEDIHGISIELESKNDKFICEPIFSFSKNNVEHSFDLEQTIKALETHSSLNPDILKKVKDELKKQNINNSDDDIEDVDKIYNIKDNIKDIIQNSISEINVSENEGFKRFLDDLIKDLNGENINMKDDEIYVSRFISYDSKPTDVVIELFNMDKNDIWSGHGFPPNFQDKILEESYKEYSEDNKNMSPLESSEFLNSQMEIIDTIKYIYNINNLNLSDIELLFNIIKDLSSLVGDKNLSYVLDNVLNNIENKYSMKLSLTDHMSDKLEIYKEEKNINNNDEQIDDSDDDEFDEPEGPF